MVISIVKPIDLVNNIYPNLMIVHKGIWHEVKSATLYKNNIRVYLAGKGSCVVIPNTKFTFKVRHNVTQQVV